MTSFVRSRRSLVALTIAAAMVLIAGACWSEHRTVTGPLAGGQCAVPLNVQTAGAVVVFIQDYSFQPATVHVPRGGRVAWVNCAPPGDVAHSSTQDAGAWDSGLIDPGQAFVETFAEPGTLTYHCEPHPFMKGTIIVD